MNDTQEEIGKFTIEANNKKVTAETIMNFELYGHYYCIYGVKNEDNHYDVYCGEIQGNTVVPIQKESDKSLTTKITKALTKTVKEGKE